MTRHNIIGSEAFDRDPPLVVKRIRDRKAWRRALAGVVSDFLGVVEAIGQRFVFGRPVDWRVR